MAADATGCINGGGVIETFSVKRLNVFDPCLDDIDILDIAHSLSIVCRYGGHCRFPYSVAQHSVLVSLDVALRGGGWDLRMAALLHDASEAYIADICRPVKVRLTEYAPIEAKLQDAIWRKFGVDYSDECHRIVKESDNRVLRVEARELMASGGEGWGLEHIGESPVTIREMDHKEAKRYFLEEFDWIARERSK